MPAYPLPEELIDAAATLEQLDMDAPGPLVLVPVEAQTLGRAARLLRTAADVVGVAYQHQHEEP